MRRLGSWAGYKTKAHLNGRVESRLERDHLTHGRAGLPVSAFGQPRNANQEPSEEVIGSISRDSLHFWAMQGVLA